MHLTAALEETIAAHGAFWAGEEELRDLEEAARRRVLAARFAYHVGKGGFAQLLFNTKGEFLKEVEQMLLDVGAEVAHDYYARAIRLALDDRRAWHQFLASDYVSDQGLRAKLDSLSLDYIACKTPFEQEIAAYLQTLGVGAPGAPAAPATEKKVGGRVRVGALILLVLGLMLVLVALVNWHFAGGRADSSVSRATRRAWADDVLSLVPREANPASFVATCSAGLKGVDPEGVFACIGSVPGPATGGVAYEDRFPRVVSRLRTEPIEEWVTGGELQPGASVLVATVHSFDSGRAVMTVRHLDASRAIVCEGTLTARATSRSQLPFALVRVACGERSGARCDLARRVVLDLE